MNFERTELAAGLYLVATPIGNARDITLRALDVLASADEIAAEDTRTARKLMELHGVPLAGRRVTAYHDHSGAGARSRIAEAVGDGRSVAYVSEAGSPLIADPGFALAREVTGAGGLVTAVPGASAVVTALSLSGLPTDRFLFAGFLPSARAARTTALAELAQVPATLVFYESPRRTAEMLADMCETLGPERRAVVARELTKKFEEVRRGTLEDLRRGCEEQPPRGEVVVMVDRPAEGQAASEADLETALREAMQGMRVKDAATAVAGALGLRKRDVYQKALELERRDRGEE